VSSYVIGYNFLVWLSGFLWVLDGEVHVAIKLVHREIISSILNPFIYKDKLYIYM